MSDQTLSPTSDDEVTSATAGDVSFDGEARPEASRKKDKKKKKKPLEERNVHEAGGVIVCDGKVVLRLTDKQHWIFPKGKLKKRETPEDAALREATEETGLRVEILDQVADLLIYHEGKKRRFVFYLMRATAKTWDWPHHDGRDTFLISPDRVASLVRHKGYAEVWEACAARVRAMCEEPTPFVSRQVHPG
jgi:8-oxo-dGTP pyrophosphatase MutT (NUDIX family)